MQQLIGGMHRPLVPQGDPRLGSTAEIVDTDPAVTFPEWFEDIRKAVRLAQLLEVPVVNGFSGLPAGSCTVRRGRKRTRSRSPCVWEEAFPSLKGMERPF